MSDAREAISRQVIAVSGFQRVSDVASEIQRTAATHCVVLDGGQVMGVVYLRDLAMASPLRIFADLVPTAPPPRANLDTPIEVVAALLQDPATDAVLVYDEDNLFAGLVTKESLLVRLLGDQKLLVAERTRLAEERAAVAHDLELLVAERTAELQKALTEMEIFSYALSHDLRAPLSRISGFAEILAEEHAAQLDDQGHEVLRRIASGAKRLDALVLEIQTLVQVAKSRVIVGPLQLGDVVDDVLIHFQVYLASRRAEVTVTTPMPPVMGHQDTLFRVIGNLVHNAAKFVSPNTRPRIQIYAEQGAMLTLYIEDNGIGIAEEYHGKIFKPFTRLNSRDDYDGTGIGLAFAKLATERMGGEIGFESTPAVGSRFWLRLKPVIDDAG